MTLSEVGKPVEILDGVRRIIAPNAGPMTYWGTNTWMLGQGRVAIIDPGPASDAHFSAILKATENVEVSHVIVTHAHADHAPLARRVSQHFDAPVYGYGPATKGRREVMTALASSGRIEGGEGVDHGFAPDICLNDNDVIGGDGWSLRALHTPGHFAGHLAFASDEAVFCGDHVMAWSTTLVSPPDGHMGDFYRSSHKLAAFGNRVFLPGHGPALADPRTRLEELVAHRKEREKSILAVVADGVSQVDDITSAVYTDVPTEMHAFATRNVLAHLIDLVERNQIEAGSELGLQADYRIVDANA